MGGRVAETERHCDLSEWKKKKMGRDKVRKRGGSEARKWR